MLSWERWSETGESFHLDIWTQVCVLGLLVQPLSLLTPKKRRGRFRHQHLPHSLQISIFNICAEIPSLLQRLCLISSLGPTARFTRRAVCSTASSFNLIRMAAPVATLPCVPILFTPCQASLTSDHDVLPSQTLPASFLTSHTLELLSCSMWLWNSHYAAWFFPYLTKSSNRPFSSPTYTSEFPSGAAWSSQPTQVTQSNVSHLGCSKSMKTASFLTHRKHI